jgi:hypothetical protein
VREHQREFFSIRPAWPVRRLASGQFIDRPGVGGAPPLHAGDDAAHFDPQTPRQIGFETIIKSAAPHGGSGAKKGDAIFSRNGFSCHGRRVKRPR